jgi:hypothetical protein
MDTVASVSSAVQQGLTVQGDNVVDNVRSSTYATAVKPTFAQRS